MTVGRAAALLACALLHGTSAVPVPGSSLASLDVDAPATEPQPEDSACSRAGACNGETTIHFPGMKVAHEHSKSNATATKSLEQAESLYERASANANATKEKADELMEKRKAAEAVQQEASASYKEAQAALKEAQAAVKLDEKALASADKAAAEEAEEEALEQAAAKAARKDHDEKTAAKKASKASAKAKAKDAAKSKAQDEELLRQAVYAEVSAACRVPPPVLRRRITSRPLPAHSHLTAPPSSFTRSASDSPRPLPAHSHAAPLTLLGPSQLIHTQRL